MTRGNAHRVFCVVLACGRQAWWGERGQSEETDPCLWRAGFSRVYGIPSRRISAQVLRARHRRILRTGRMTARAGFAVVAKVGGCWGGCALAGVKWWDILLGRLAGGNAFCTLRDICVACAAGHCGGNSRRECAAADYLRSCIWQSYLLIRLAAHGHDGARFTRNSKYIHARKSGARS
jgi:hypothetical protein